MGKQEFQKVYSQYRREQYNHRSSDRSHLPCGDQDAAFDRHEMYMESLIDAHPVLRAVQAQLDGRDQLTFKAENEWNMRNHYRQLKRKKRRSPLTDAQREYFAREQQDQDERYEAEQEYCQRERDSIESEYKAGNDE